MIKKKNKNNLLTAKQLAFCDEYLVDLNATQAAIRAGYVGANVRCTASELLAKPNISDEIARRMQDRQRRTEITQDKVLSELAKIAFFDVRKIVNESGRLLQIKDIDDQTAGAIVSIDISKNGNEEFGGNEILKLRFADKRAALVDIGKHLGMFKEKMEITGNDGGPINLTTVDPKKISTSALAEILAAKDAAGA